MSESNFEPVTRSAPSSHSRIFFGPDGLRAGWSLLIAIIMFMAWGWALSTLVHASGLVPRHAMEHAPGPRPVFVGELAIFLAVLITTFSMARIEHRPVGVYGLGGVRKLPRLLAGAVTGLLAISLLVFLLLKSGLLVIDRQLLAGTEALRYALAWIPGFLAIGFFEESLFRGYLQYTLARGLAGLARSLPGNRDPRALGFWAAALIVSFGFGAVHGSNPGESPAGLVCAGLASLLFCFSLWRTGSLWWAVGMHAAWDYGQSFVFGVADSGALFGHRLLETHPLGAPLLSGGATGPEGSIFCLLPLALMALLIHFTQPRTESSYASLMQDDGLPVGPTARGAVTS